MLIAIIAACEVLFWVFVLLGLITRYVVRRERASVVILALAPLADIVLLSASAISIRAGDTPTIAHTLAAFYLGFSIAYGHRMIAWADARFARHYRRAPLPAKLGGKAYALACWRDVLLTGVAMAVTWAVLYGMEQLAHPSTDTHELEQGYGIAGLIFVIEVLWALSYTIWPRKVAAV